MKKLILSFILLCNIGLAGAQNIQPANWWPQAGQAAATGTTNGWYYHSDAGDEYLAFDGSIITGTRIATKFGPLIWQPYKNISIKFDATMPARGTGTITMVNIGSNNVWGGAGILVEFTGYGLRVVKNFDYANNLTWIDSSEGYKSAIGSGGVVAGNEINISATGLMTFKVGNYVCPTTYQADVTLLDAAANQYVLFCPGATGFRLKNVIAKKGAIANTFFPEYKYTISCSSNNGTMGSVTGNGEFHKTADVTLIATAASGYRFVNWTESGTQVSTDASYTFAATANRTLVANFEQDLGTGLYKSISQASVRIYPIPAVNGVFNMKSEGLKGVVTLKITDISGKVVYRKNFSEQTNISVNAGLKAGVYQLTVSDGNKTLNSKLVCN